MPQVPDIPGVVPQVQPFERPVPLPGVDVPREAFTGVTNAIQTFGGDVEKASTEVFNRAMALKHLQIDNNIRDLATAYFNEVSPEQSDFLSRDDVTAADLTAHNAKLETVRQKYVGLAGQFGPYGMNQFGADSSSMQRSFIREATLHSADRGRKYTIQNFKSASELAQNLSSRDPDDEVAFKKNLTDSDANVASATQMEFGAKPTDPITLERQLVGRSNAALRRVNGWLEKGDPDSAKNFIDNNPKLFTNADYQHAQLLVGGRAHAMYSTAIVDDFLKKHVKQDGTMDMSNRDAQELIRQQARDRYPNLKELPEQAVQAFDSRIYKANLAGRNDGITARTQFWQMVGQYKPETAEDFYKIPAENGHISGTQMADMLGKVDPQFSIPKHITTFNLNANLETEKRALVRLNGMITQGTEGGVREFLGIKDWGAYGIKNPDDIIKLQNEQLRLSKNPATDPRVSDAIRLGREYYGKKMHDLGIYKRDEKRASKREDYDSFVGLLQQGLVKWHDDHNNTNPDNKTIIDEILPQVLHTHAVERLGGWWTSRQEPVFHGYVKPMPEDVPKQFADDHYNEAVKRGGSPPTPAQIYNAYLRTQYDKIMELESKASGGAVVGPAVPGPR